MSSVPASPPSTSPSAATPAASSGGSAQKAAAFAVVMTVKNGRPWIEEAIPSVLPALGQDGELVVVDAVSTDGTTDYLRGMSGRSSLRLVVEPCSMGRGRHRGILETGAPVVITQVDADVRYRPEAIRTGVAALQAHPGTGMVLVVGERDPDPDGTKLFVWDRAFYLRTPGYPDVNVADDVVAVRQALLEGKVRRCLVDRIGDDLRTASRGYVAVREPWKKGPGFFRQSRRRYAQGWTWGVYVRFLWVTRRTTLRFLAGMGLATIARLAPAA